MNKLTSGFVAATLISMASISNAAHHTTSPDNSDAESSVLVEQNPLDLKDKFVMRLHDGVNYSSSKTIIENFRKFAKSDPDKDIVFYINSGGGSVTQAMAIYDTMQSIPNDIITVCEGNAQSAAFFLLTSGTPGKRYAMPNCALMGHQTIAGENGPNETREIYVEHTTIESDRFLGIIADNSGWDRQTLIDIMSHNMYLYPDEAIEMGFIDKILPPAKPQPGPGHKKITDLPDWYCDGKRGEIIRICSTLNYMQPN
jgi:ATP-dependent Clp protease, protease subunit